MHRGRTRVGGQLLRRGGVVAQRRRSARRRGRRRGRLHGGGRLLATGSRRCGGRGWREGDRGGRRSRRHRAYRRRRGRLDELLRRRLWRRTLRRWGRGGRTRRRRARGARAPRWRWGSARTSWRRGERSAPLPRARPSRRRRRASRRPRSRRGCGRRLLLRRSLLRWLLQHAATFRRSLGQLHGAHIRPLFGRTLGSPLEPLEPLLAVALAPHRLAGLEGPADVVGIVFGCFREVREFVRCRAHGLLSRGLDASPASARQHGDGSSAEPRCTRASTHPPLRDNRPSCRAGPHTSSRARLAPFAAAPGGREE